MTFSLPGIKIIKRKLKRCYNWLYVFKFRSLCIDCSVFASSEEPLVVLLKLECCDVASVALELCFAICCNSAHCIVGYIVDFDKIVGSDAHVFAVSSQSEFVDLCLG